jgi:hypothetical protein
MAYRFKAYTGLPGSYGFPVAALTLLANYPAEADVEDTVLYGSRNEQEGDLVVEMGDAVFPALANVWHDTGLYGPTGVEYTPSKVASSITNCTADNIKANVAIDDVTGTYGPAQALVVTPDPTDALAVDAASFLADFGETVIYRPAAVGAATRTIVAVVNRPEPQPSGPVNAWEGMAITITVANNATTGISAAELDSGRDKIDVALRVGGTVAARPIVGIVSQDSGMLTLEVR